VTRPEFFTIGPLAGDLVALEPLRPEHARPLAAAAAEGRDRYVFTDVPSDEADAVRYIGTALEQQATNAVVPFAIRDVAGNRIVGSTRFCYFEYWHWKPQYRTRPVDQPEATQIGGTWLARDSQRTGLNREAKLLMLDIAFERWQVERVRLRTDARNVRSRTAIEGIGAVFEGVLRADSAGYDGIVRDSAAFSILAREWPAVRRRLRGQLDHAAGVGPSQ
jgi:RimJ/RimL family protein N-acetyltransferase